MTAAAEHPRYTQRTVEWGHWGITFMEPQPDRSKNYGVIVGTVSFGVGTRGPVDAGQYRDLYRLMCSAWVDHGVLPNTIAKAEGR